MSISIKNLVDKFNTAVGNSPTELQLMQLSVAANSISNVYSVATSTQLPVASENTGRLIYVDDLKAYRYSDGMDWVSDFSSNQQLLALTWGCGSSGRLGDGTTTNKSSPVYVLGGFTDWCQVSSGRDFTNAIRTNGTLWAWGCNGSGRLGDGTTVDKFAPVAVLGDFTWCQVSSGNNHSLALRNNGTLWAWGFGYLGNDTASTFSSPVSVVGGFTDWCQVSAGYSHSAAVRTNGTLWSWGTNSFSGSYSSGELGDGTSVAKSSPVSVIGGFTDWCQVSAGRRYTLAVRQNGTLWAWGIGSLGILGDGTTVCKSSPVSVIGGFTDWCQVSASENHSAAVRTNGTLWTWGSNCFGRLGDGTTVCKSSPVSIVGGFTDWCLVSLGGDHTSALRTNGSLWSWGSNCVGRLGDGTTTNRCSPVNISGVWSKLDVGYAQSITIKTKGF